MVNSGQQHSRRVGFNWTIARKIGGLATVLILFILGLLLYSIITLRGIQTELSEIATFDVPLSELTNRIEVEQLELQITTDRLLRNLARKGESGDLSVSAPRVEKHAEVLEQVIAQGLALSKRGQETSFAPVFAEVHTALGELQGEAALLHAELGGILALIEAGQVPGGEREEALLARGEAFDARMLAVVRQVEQFTDREIRLLEEHERVFFLVNTSLGTAGVLLGVVLSAVIIIGIRTNLFRLSRWVDEVGQAVADNREIRTDMLGVSSSDEIGRLADNLSRMVDNVSTDLKRRDEVSRQLQEIATKDPLTGAWNRFKWDEALRWEIERNKRSQDDLSLILFDIDHFKRVNDGFGHDAGDRVLKEMVALVQAEIRQSDSLYRLGGEEFAILAPFTRLEPAGILAEKIRQTVEAHMFPDVGKVTVSMGCAVHEKTDEDGTRFYTEADRKLYTSKTAGRNRVTLDG